ncbi:MAG: hypothetical protein ACR2KH_06630 [Sphingomicrobium sp.]
MGDIRHGDQSARTQRGGPPPGTRVIVDVYADGQPGAVTFKHEWRFDDNSRKGNGEIDIPAKKKDEDGTPIQFNLHDRTRPKVGLKFVNDDNAMWSDRTICPQYDAAWDSEITSIRPSERVLHVVDLNKDECVLHYNLRFEPDPQTYCYDPEIRNGGTTVA